jgi:hypothetical protein
MADVYAQIATKIIEQQETIIGPVAIEQAQGISGLTVDWGTTHSVSVSGDESKVLDDLVKAYKNLFGQISVEVCKEAAANLIGQLPPADQPKLLK